MCWLGECSVAGQNVRRLSKLYAKVGQDRLDLSSGLTQHHGDGRLAVAAHQYWFLHVHQLGHIPVAMWNRSSAEGGAKQAEVHFLVARLAEKRQCGGPCSMDYEG